MIDNRMIIEETIRYIENSECFDYRGCLRSGLADGPSDMGRGFLITNAAIGWLVMLGKYVHPTKHCFWQTKIACKTSSFSKVIGIPVGQATDQPFHQTASVLLSDQGLRLFFYCNVTFELNSLDNCKCHSLWELTYFVSFSAMSGTVVVIVVCIYVLFDKILLH